MKDNQQDYRLFGVDFGSNKEQRELIRLIREDPSILPVVYCFGRAGTGKTFATLAAALSLVYAKGAKKRYEAIYYIREPVEIGHRLGYLKGTEQDKFAPYLGPLLDNLSRLAKTAEEAGVLFAPKRRKGDAPNDDLMSAERIYGDLPKLVIPLAPEFLRGRTFADSILIVDEAQNMTLDELQTIVTRIGERSKLVLLGSPNQIDIEGQSESDNDFAKSYDILAPTGLVKKVVLEASMRSSFVGDFDERFVAYKRNHPKKKAK